MATVVTISYNIVEAYFFSALFEEIFDPDNADLWAAIAGLLLPSTLLYGRNRLPLERRRLGVQGEPRLDEL